MKALINDYAIGPGLHDWNREKEDLEDMQREAEEEAFNQEFDWARITLFCDRNKPKGGREILYLMNEAMSNLYDNDNERSEFDSALFTWYCSNNDRDAIRSMNELLDKHIKAVIRRRCARDSRIAA